MTFLLLSMGLGNTSRFEWDHMAEQRRVLARSYNSGFGLAHDTYNGITAASDGKIYYVLCSESIDVGAQVYSFDPATATILHLGDLTEACGDRGSKAIPQNKSHVSFWEADGKLYFASDIGYYTIDKGMETMGSPPPGYKPYPGGCFLAYDMAAEKFESLAREPHGEGIFAMTIDPTRARLYGLSWPSGYFIRYDLAKRHGKDLGKVSMDGEAGRGPKYRTLCRSLVLDPQDGSVYFTTADGFILRYQYDRDCIERVQGEDMKKDYFGYFDPSSPGTMAYNWRQALWYPPDRCIYGVHGNSGYLFRFDPYIPRVEVIERLTSLPSRRSGMFDQFSYGYLGFALGPDGHTLHYLTGGPIYVDGKRLAGKSSTAKGESKGDENLHLVTYDILKAHYIDHGAIFFNDGQRPSYVNSLAVAKDGTMYALSRIKEKGQTRTDLMSVPSPFHPS